MRRLLILTSFACAGSLSSVAIAATPTTMTGGASAAPKTGSANPAHVCRYTPPAPAFPNVRRLRAAGTGCAQAVRVAESIQRYWSLHSTLVARKALPGRAGGLACTYRLLHEPTGDPYFRAICGRAGGAPISMDLTS